MSYASFLASEKPAPSAVPTGAPTARGRSEEGTHCMLAASRTEIEFAVATLSRTGDAGRRPRAAAMPPVVDALTRFAGAIAHREVAEVGGRRAETGRVLSGVAALGAIAADFDAFGEHRGVRIDLRAVSRTLASGTSPVRAFEDRTAWHNALETSANRTQGLRRAVSMRAEPRRAPARAASGHGR